jgi:transposase-like protein
MNARKTKSEMYPLVEQYLSSNETLAKFCESKNVKPHVLNYWLQKYRKQESSSSLLFQPVEINKSSTEKNIVIRYPNGTNLIIPFPC